MRHAIYALVGLSIFIVCVIVLWVGATFLQNRLTFRNESGQPITKVTIKVGGETIRFDDVRNEETRSSGYSIRGDGSFEFHARLEDGSEVNETAGYVTNGTCSDRAEFIVTPDGSLKFKQNPMQEYFVMPRKAKADQ